ncbi:MAG: hypothetical protein JWM44_2012 [Bacilli bacterium]|nr:hypothetical protein [Bacilli bacterium]
MMPWAWFTFFLNETNRFNLKLFVVLFSHCQTPHLRMLLLLHSRLSVSIV